MAMRLQYKGLVALLIIAVMLIPFTAPLSSMAMASTSNNTTTTTSSNITSGVNNINKTCTIPIRLLNYTLKRIVVIEKKLEKRNITIPVELREEIDKLQSLNTTILSCKDAEELLKEATSVLRELVGLLWSKKPTGLENIMIKARELRLRSAINKLWPLAKRLKAEKAISLLEEARKALRVGDLDRVERLVKKAWAEIEALEATRLTPPLLHILVAKRHIAPGLVGLLVRIAGGIGALAARINASDEALVRVASSLEALVSTAEAKTINESRISLLAEHAIKEAEEAISLAEKAIARANNTKPPAAIERAETLLEKAKTLLEEAKKSYNNTNYVEALVEAKTAKGLAIAASAIAGAPAEIWKIMHRPWIEPRHFKKMAGSMLLYRIKGLNETISSLYAKAVEENNTKAIKILDEAQNLLAKAAKAAEEGAPGKALALYMRALALVAHAARLLGAKLEPWKPIMEKYKEMVKELEEKIAKLEERIEVLKNKTLPKPLKKMLERVEEMLDKAKEALEEAKKLAGEGRNPLPALMRASGIVRMLEKLVERIEEATS